MAKEPFVIPSRPGKRDSSPPQHVIFSIGGQRYRIEPTTKIMLLPTRPAEVIPINGNQRDKSR